MAGTREVKDGVQVQGVGEKVAYKVDLTDWPNPPTNPTLEAEDLDGNDVKSTLFPTGNPTVNGNLIELPICEGGTLDAIYRIIVGYEVDGNTLKVHFYVRFEND